MRHFLALVLIAVPALCGAQAATVSPGMTRAQVVSALGQPVTVREAGDHTYMFYRNECGRACGMNDLVTLRRDSVVDAIFRSPTRHYTGTSSSPTPLSREGAQRGAATPSKPMTMPSREPARPAQAIPLAKEPAAPAAGVTKQATEADRARLRQQLIGTGLTNTQIRARLRAEGYPADLLDADIRGAAAASPRMTPGAPNDTRPSMVLPDSTRPATKPAPDKSPDKSPTTTPTRPPAQ